jgi:hypothetical protein
MSCDGVSESLGRLFIEPGRVQGLLEVDSIPLILIYSVAVKYWNSNTGAICAGCYIKLINIY